MTSVGALQAATILDRAALSDVKQLGTQRALTESASKTPLLGKMSVSHPSIRPSVKSVPQSPCGQKHRARHGRVQRLLASITQPRVLDRHVSAVQLLSPCHGMPQHGGPQDERDHGGGGWLCCSSLTRTEVGESPSSHPFKTACTGLMNTPSH